MAMSMIDAAEQVLRTHSLGAPMHYRRITQIAVEEGLIESDGATPEASMSARLSTDIRARSAAERDQRFAAHGRGFYGLAEPVDPLGGAINAKNLEVRGRLRAVLSEMDPKDFEHLMGQLLGALGFEDVRVTKYSGDGGIDLRARLSVGGVTDVRTAVQVKRWSNSVSGRTVRELRGGLGPHERGLVITLSTFTRDAQREADEPDRSPISLVDGERLIDLLVENEIGVSRRRVTILELDEGSLLPSDETPTTIEPTPTLGTSLSQPPARSDKMLSVWPLPGGGTVWKQSLDSMLRYVASAAPSLREATGWMLKSFERVNSEKVARGYWQVPRSFGLLETVGERLQLTADGASYIEAPEAELLVSIMRKNVAGVDELLDILAVGSLDTSEATSLLNDRLGVRWESDAQTRFRLLWLENLGVAVQRDGRWRRAEAGVA